MKITLLVLLGLTLVANAFTALPALGYSSSAGFIIGGYFVFPMMESQSLFSIDTYYGTNGVIKFQPNLIKKTDWGFLESSLEIRKVLERNWYGWGNETDGDSTALMDFEKGNLLFGFAAPLGDKFFIASGLDVRHSSIFNREQSNLWDNMPGEVYASTWTGGLYGEAGVNIPIPLNGNLLVATDGFFQMGDVSYSGVTTKIKGTVSPWNRAELSLGGRVHKQFNIEETPIVYGSGIGQNLNFRGYNDYRFSGAVWSLAQIELEQDLFTLKNPEELPLLTMSIAVFAENGTVADSFDNLSFGDSHYDYGCGVRFELNPEAKMRVDTAWGDNGMLIQTGFDRAF